MVLDTKVEEVGRLIAESIHREFKEELVRRLREHANEIIEQTADKMASELLLRTDSYFSSTNPGNPFNPEIRILLRINEKEKQFVVEKTVKTV